MGKKINITTKLLLSYGVLAVCILVVGLLSYTVAARAIMESYKASAMQSLDMLGEYIEYGLENASAQAVTYLADAEMGNYLSGRMSQGDQISYYSRTRTALINKASADLFISNLYLLSDQAPSLSTESKSLEKTYSAFLETAQGQEALAESQSFLWFGQIPEIDDMFGVDKDSYAVRMVKQFYRTDAAVLIDIDKEVIQEILEKAVPGEGSSVVFVTEDGRVIRQDGGSLEGLYESEFYQTAVGGGDKSGTIEDVVFGGTGNLFIYRRIGDTRAMACVLIPNELLSSQVSGIQYVTAGALLASSVLALVIALGISLGMKRTVQHMVQNMNLIAQGNMDVRMPWLLNSLHTSERKLLFFMVSHPAFEVRASSASGTSVTWAGFTSLTRSMNLGIGFPSILSSVEMAGLMALTSEYLICLSSGLGWTVIPSAPNFSQSVAAFSTSGMFPPLEFLRVAILFMLTLSFVMSLMFCAAKIYIFIYYCLKFGKIVLFLTPVWQ